MDTYKISYRAPGMDEMRTTTVTAPDIRAAERSFKAGFKHSNHPAPDIFKTELIAENTPATKDQEREAMEKIKAILDTLGPASYVGTALEGCLEIAEENIENDWACSMKQRVEAVVVENTRLKDRVKELEDKLAESEKDCEAAHEAAHLVADEKDAEIANLKAQVSSLAETGRWNAEKCDEVRSEAWDLQKRAEKAEAEVVRLKAKLYDYMTAGA